MKRERRYACLKVTYGLLREVDLLRRLANPMKPLSIADYCRKVLREHVDEARQARVAFAQQFVAACAEADQQQNGEAQCIVAPTSDKMN